MILLIAQALAVQVQLDVDTRGLQVGETTQLRLSVVGGAADHTPQLQDLPELRMDWVGARQGTVNVNLRNERVVTYIWNLTALREGSPVIGPITLSVRGQDYETNSLQLEVAPKGVVETEVLTSNLLDQVWQGQVVVQNLVFRSPRRVVDSSWSLPPYEGLMMEPTAQATERQYTVMVDGVAVQVVELNVPLRLLEAGSTELAGTVLTVQIPTERQRSRPRFGRGVFTEVESEIFSSGREALEVRPLPAGQDEHWSGLVGRFEVDATLTDATIKAGDSTTLLVRLSGDGTLGGFKLPDAEGEGFRAYDDDPELEVRVDSEGFWTRATFRRAIVPEGPGELLLPAVVLQVFDPIAGTYVDLTIPEQRLEVADGAQGSGELQAFSNGQLDRRAQVSELGEDILPIHAGASGSDLPSWWMLLAGLPALAFGLLGLRRPAREEDPRARLLARLRSCGEDPAELEELFREALALALQRPAAGIERADLELLPETLRGPCDALYLDIGQARYGGQAGSSLRQRVQSLGEALCC